MEDYSEKRDYILPERVLATAGTEGADNLLRFRSDIASFVCGDPCRIAPGGYVLLDFGREYQGGVKLVAQDMMGKKNARVRIRFGESAMECCSEPGHKGSTNDHSVRDESLLLPWAGCLEYGMTGYRFIRIDNLDEVVISLIQVLGVYVHSGKKMRGEFRCSDARVNDVWKASARTLYLNNNRYITDGIKRDRLVWIGDMHPETIAVLRLFGDDPSIRRSLDFIRDLTDFPGWMNDIPAYSMWWLKIQLDLYRYTGDLGYLRRQREYVRGLCAQLLGCVNEDGSDNIGYKFIDWPSSEDAEAQEYGIRALLKVAFESCREILDLCGDSEYASATEEALARLALRSLPPPRNKQAAALGVFAGVLDPVRAEREIFSCNELEGLSTFLCYYILRARARAGNMRGALGIVRNYYGGMLDLGATTMWEDFDLSWKKGAKPIDSLLREGEYDVHGDNGGYCYKGYRHSLCHGWAAGTVPFTSEFILGVRPEEGGKKLVISPDLGDLEWAEGKFPAQSGDLELSCRKKYGKIEIEYQAPAGVEVVVRP